jgi:hypothetical protein
MKKRPAFVPNWGYPPFLGSACFSFIHRDNFNAAHSAGLTARSKNSQESLASKAFAAAARSVKPEPSRGFYFRMLKSQGPQIPVAWPAEYRQGLVYGKGLGSNTATLARQMALFNPERSSRRSDLEWGLRCR